MPNLRPRDEQGSVIVAMTIIAVLALLAAAVMTRTLSGQTSARQAQEFAAALGPADAGVSDMLLRLDQVGSGTPPATFCVGSAACNQAALAGSPDAAYIATYNAATDIVTVRSKGSANGRTHAVQAEIGRGGAFPFALFGVSSVTFNGNTGTGNIQAVDASGNPTNTVDADVGSNGTITCNSNSGGQGGEHNVAYPGGSVGASCNGPTHLTEGEYTPKAPIVRANCANEERTVPETPCYDPTTVNCPVNLFTLQTAASGTQEAVYTVSPGQYYCNASVTFPVGYVKVTGTGVFELFVVPPTGTSANVTMANSFVNVDPGTNRAANQRGDDVDGDPTRFRVYVAGTGTNASSGVVQTGGGSASKRFVGIFYAPESSLTSDGCQMEWRGALVFHTFNCNGGPNLTIQYDTRVAELRDATWTVNDYHEIGSSQVNIP